MSTKRTIVLQGTLRYDEAVAVAACSPGHWLEKDSDGKVKKHATAGGYHQRIIATEDRKQGRTIDDAYSIGDPVFFQRAAPGDRVLCRVAAGIPAITLGTLVQLDGAGGVRGLAQGGGDLIYRNVATSAEIGDTSAAEAAFDKTATIAANTLRVGDVIHIRAAGRVTTANSTDTVTIKLKIGTTVITATVALDATTADVWVIDTHVIIRTIGASGTFVASGLHGVGPLTTSAMRAYVLGSTAIDTTAAQTISVTGQFSVSHADNGAVLEELTVEKSGYAPAGIPVGVAEEALDNSAGSADAFLATTVL